MWQSLMDWLPDLAPGGTIYVSDMLQVVSGLFGGLLAAVALRMARCPRLTTASYF